MNFSKPEYPLISVVTVSFNAADFISQTIESVLSQTYPHIEYIIIDGGSTDGTAEIIQGNESRLAYWHSKPDRGLAHAFNLGLSHAHGAWILFLNADDFFLDSTVVETMIPFLMSNSSYDVIYGQAIFMTQSKNPLPAPFRKIFGEAWCWQKFRFRDLIPHQAAFTNHRYFDRKGWFDEAFRIIVDYELYLRGGNELKAQFIPIAMVAIREGGLSAKNLVNTLREGRLAHQKNQVLPRGLPWVNFFAQVGRCYLGRLSHKLLDRFAHKITWQGRNCPNLLK